MSLKIDFTLKLISDAEPSSGFGSELINALVPRDMDGKPVIPSTHIKGLMKQAIIDAKNALEYSDSILDGSQYSIDSLHQSGSSLSDADFLDALLKRAFGLPGDDSDIGSLFFVSNCQCQGNSTIRPISRTSLNKYGTAKETSLRTTEAISAGTVFKGSILFPAEPEKELDLLIRFSLLSIMEIGGGRNRGSGACIVNIFQESEERRDNKNNKANRENREKFQQPGELLLELLKLKLAHDKDRDSNTLIKPLDDISVNGDFSKRVAVKLTFTADGQLCVPELPIVGTNVISSGFSIPASAVQGMILTRINALHSTLADGCYNSDNFRAWSMQPLPPLIKEEVSLHLIKQSGNSAELSNSSDQPFYGLPLRASASHKISKLPFDDGTYSFCDEIIEPYEWTRTPKNSPLKSADGVLVPTKDGVMLWRSADMPRYISAHGVHNSGVEPTDSSDRVIDDRGKRTLFTVEALAVNRFMGLVYMPENAANMLIESLRVNPVVQLGKARSVRGSGSLEAEIINNLTFKFPNSADNKDSSIPAFIVQSPILVDDAVAHDAATKSVNTILKDMVEKAGWGKVEEASGSTQILFGWSRHKKGLQKAQLVIVPGSVFRLAKIPDNIENLLVRGIGKGRERGYGAVLPHPGIATQRFSGNLELNTMKSRDKSGAIGWSLWTLAKSSGLMPSQIAKLQSILGEDKDMEKAKNSALEYIERQRKERPAKIWDRWKSVIGELQNQINQDSVQALKALKVWHDLAVANETKGGSL